jgi:hypothetical protein
MERARKLIAPGVLEYCSLTSFLDHDANQKMAWKSYVLARLRHDPNAAVATEGHPGCGGSEMSDHGSTNTVGALEGQENVP